MGRGICVAVLVCLLAPLVSTGQSGPNEAPAHFGFTVGATLFQVRDGALNDIRHQGLTVSLGLFREGGTAASRKRLGFSLTVAPLTDRYSPDRSSVVFSPAVDFRWVKRARALTDDVTLFLGGAAGWSTHLAWYENWDQGHVYWLTASHLDVAATLACRRPGGGSFLLDLDAPVLALVSRPPERFEYKEVNPSPGWILGRIHQGSRLTSVGDHRAAAMTLSWTGAHAPGRSLYWRTAYTSNQTPGSAGITILTHTFGVSFPF